MLIVAGAPLFVIVHRGKVVHLFSSVARLLALIFLLGFATPSADAAAPQVWGQDDGFKPFDIRAEIRAHYARRLPRGWYIGDPLKTDNGYDLRLIIDWAWKGNPVSATLNLCPPRQSVIWQHIKRLYVTPSHRSLRYAGVECR